MPAHNDLSDDHVARVLQADAQRDSARYVTEGLRAFLPQRPSGQAPKPNTRFLRNILRDTDNHNAALLAKEKTESDARLKALHKEEDRSGRDILHQRPKPKHRYLDVDDEDHGAKRRKVESEPEELHEYRRYRDRSPHRSRRDRSSEGRSKRSRRDELSEDEDRHARRSRRSDKERKSRSHRHRDRSRSRDRSKTRESRRHRHRHRSSSLPRSRSPDKSRRSRRSKRSHSRSRSPRPRHSKKARDRASKADSPISLPKEPGRLKEDSDSDPLEDIIGPLPPTKEPVRSRGRGQFTSSSRIDQHFADDYDPTADVAINSDDDDWEMALEALKDRQKWRQQGAERLRAAGFADHDVKKWEKGGERTEEDVRWAKKGEGREWDRGKVIGPDGHIVQKPSWATSSWNQADPMKDDWEEQESTYGRLKGT